MKVCILSCIVIRLRLKAGYTMILTVSLQFAKKCFWSATVFRSAERRNINNINRDKRILHSCPICSSGNISLIAITNGIFRK